MMQFTLEIFSLIIITIVAFTAGVVKGESQMKRHMEKERKNGIQ